jgi:hypothetical protein
MSIQFFNAHRGPLAAFKGAEELPFPASTEDRKQPDGSGPLETQPAQSAEREQKKAIPAKPAPTDRFTPFSQPVIANPVPDKWEFYWSELKANMRPAIRQGGEQYKEALLKDEHTRLKALSMLFATGIGLTIFRRLRRTATFLLFMAILGKPIMVATQAFPKMSEAYEEVKNGNPSKGREKFRDALDESFYSIFKDFLKPVSYGIMLAYLLEVPFIFQNEGKDIRHHIIRNLADLLHINRNAKPIVRAYEKMKPYVHWGDRQANRIREQVPLLDWIEDPRQLSLPKAFAEKAQLLAGIFRRGLKV